MSWNRITISTHTFRLQVKEEESDPDIRCARIADASNVAPF